LGVGKGSGDGSSASILAFVGSIAVISGPKTPLFLHHAFVGALHTTIVGFVASHAIISRLENPLFSHDGFAGPLHAK
jgi:hypothetical protein